MGKHRSGRGAALGMAGVTLAELMVVLAVVSVLALAMGFSFQGWIARYKTEGRVKEMQVDIMNARARAMQQSLRHFFFVSGNTYTIYVDDNPAPDGDGLAVPGVDTEWLEKDTGKPIIVNGISAPFWMDRNGLINTAGALRFRSDPGVDYDCVEIGSTRVNIGLWNGTGCVSK